MRKYFINKKPKVQQKSCYTAPSVKVISINTQCSILKGSDNIYNTEPTEMDEENVF
ncbi:MAG: hypothetical protein KBS65_05595 [Prevotella sp.]|nr:hypothetical protein [Candidatus Equicola stercoris]